MFYFFPVIAVVAVVVVVVVAVDVTVVVVVGVSTLPAQLDSRQQSDANLIDHDSRCCRR